MDMKVDDKAGVAVSGLLEAIAKAVPIIARVYHEHKCSVCPKNKTDEPTPADRLEAIWNKLDTFMSSARRLVLEKWAFKEIGYRYYVVGQKQPIELCKYIRDRLRDLNEKHLTELEAILE